MSQFPAYNTTFPAHGKINLGLQVFGRREDGFHEIETVMLPIGWRDTVSVHPSASFDFTCSDPSLPVDDTNLVVRAAKAFSEAVGSTEAFKLNLEKVLPYGAGLGSGSSDAATTLLALNELSESRLSDSELYHIAAEIGSDVPFFLVRQACVATGRGEVLSPLRGTEGEPYSLPYSLVVAVPDVHVSTAEAYSMITPRRRNRNDLAKAVLSNDLDRWRRELVNDFQGPVASRYPSVQRGLDLLEEGGAGYFSLSGSGSAVFGVFKNDDDAQRAFILLELRGFRVWIESSTPAS
ncbi:MAG: 4-(cytidine 5'-diphospho)-2-C-methyl-D-erythritol kinase [Rubricoccaceae bacterium]|nr:4-(cytidine 5'-diphospho)-2-C-methyl-D-erythritol kinase [Rubricoccaceae bacterium]